ncbi:MAG: hypothetical protein HDR15_09765 [Lachnospiraceae bacterium]|nr:hypothetical protein [Lachnospiraceae bacterium]
MNENYEEYKKNFSRDQKKRDDLHSGKWQLLLGLAFLIYTLFILPFHADNVRDLRGDEVKAGKIFYPLKVYYIENLQILRAKTDADDDQLYCIAKFLDCDQNEWIISFTPGKNERLVQDIRLADRFDRELNLTVSGYFHLKPLEEFPSQADSFFTVYGASYANADGSNMLSVNAEYLCDRRDNYTLKLLLQPGIPFGSLVTGLVSVIMGGFLLIKNRSRKEN